MKVLVIGVVGFIGFIFFYKLLDRGDEVIGLDNLNDYYDVLLKEVRLKWFQDCNGFIFVKVLLEDWFVVEQMFKKEQF